MEIERVKKVPMRTCIVCKNVFSKKDLLRIVKTNEGVVFIDKTGRANGRGAYICTNPLCMETCIKKKVLNKAFKCALDDKVYSDLAEQYANENK